MITELQQGKKSRLELYEIVELIEKSDESKRVELIREYSKMYSSFSDYLRCLFDDRIQLLLPEGRPPFTPAEEDKFPSSWHKQNVKLKYFVKGLKAEHMHPLKRETMFIGVLESVHPADAELLCDMLSKTPPKGLSVETVKEAVPNLIMTS